MGTGVPQAFHTWQRDHPNLEHTPLTLAAAAGGAYLTVPVRHSAATRTYLSEQFVPIITEPEAIIASHLFYPHRMFGRTRYQIETTTNRYSSNELPMIRDAGNKPIVLTEEIGIGSIVRLAIGADGLLRAVQVMQPVYADPFAAAFAEAA
jgi:hypothetical protein